MRELRIGTWVAALTALVWVGCDNGNGGDHDAGSTTGHDSGTHTTTPDSGPSTTPDSGPSTTPDSGMSSMGDGGASTCGPLGACDLTDPSSCGTGMACLLNGDGSGGVTTQCFGAGTGTDGTTCDPTMAGQCAEGFGCSSEENVCRGWCCTDSDCNPATTGQVCSKINGAGPAGHEYGQCIQPDACTLPAPQTGCPDGQECNVITLASGSSITNCDSAGTATEGMTCNARNACVAGYACVGSSDGTFSCRAYCDMSAATPCTSGFTCGGLTGAPSGFGVCTPSA